MQEVTKPTIHLNGTSPEALLAQYEQSALAISQAIRLLEEASPHGRDYYPQGPQALTAARAEHVTRLEVLHGVQKELQQLIEHVASYNAG